MAIFVIIDLSWDVVVFFIGGIVDHRCLNFVFIINLFFHFVAAVNLCVNGMWWSQSTRWELDLMPSAQMAHWLSLLLTIQRQVTPPRQRYWLTFKRMESLIGTQIISSGNDAPPNLWSLKNCYFMSVVVYEHFRFQSLILHGQLEQSW
jgi:hypothetical protein